LGGTSCGAPGRPAELHKIEDALPGAGSGALQRLGALPQSAGLCDALRRRRVRSFRQVRPRLSGPAPGAVRTNAEEDACQRPPGVGAARDRRATSVPRRKADVTVTETQKEKTRSR